MPSRRRATRSTLTGSLSDVQRRLRFVEARPSPTRLANQVVTRTNIQPRAVSTDQIALESVTDSLLAVDSVGSAELQPGAVTSESFAPGAVTQTALDDDSVGQDQLQNDSVGENQLQNDSVGSGQLQDGSVGTSQLENGAVTESKIDNGAVTESKIDDGAVTTNKIRNGAVSRDKIQDDAINSAKIAAGAVGSSELGPNSVTQAKIGPQAVGNAQIESQAVDSAKIETGAISTIHLANFTAIAANVTSSGNGISVSRTQLTGGSRYTATLSIGTGSTQVAAGNHQHGINSSGNHAYNGSGVHVHSYTAFYSWSSAKLKKDISDHRLENHEALLDIPLKRFKYKNSKRDEQEKVNRDWMYGYMAEDLQAAGLEEVLGYDEDGEVISVNYALLSIYLVEIVKSQNARIKALESVASRKETEDD